MKIKDIFKKIAILEERVQFLESKLNSKKSSDLREEKWSEFHSIIRLQQKNKSRDIFN